jgi:3'-phosphoadenosine 5'-phosphosulfate sulfotransferase (PAPS reductase)/FAD synthetase
MVKVNPIVSWHQKQVDNYIAEHGILVNPLVYDGYPSIGCSTCTCRAAPGDDPRSGHWEDRVRHPHVRFRPPERPPSGTRETEWE